VEGHPSHAAAARWWRERALPSGWQEAVAFAAEPAGLDDALSDLCSRDRSSPHFWSDAYLAAFAIASGSLLATFDQGFARFAGLGHELIR
jgi:hypothetical protein